MVTIVVYTPLDIIKVVLRLKRKTTFCLFFRFGNDCSFKPVISVNHAFFQNSSGIFVIHLTIG